MNVRAAYQRAIRDFSTAGIPEPQADAALLLASVLGIERHKLPLVYEQELSGQQEAKFAGLSARRVAREPVQYLLGTWHFMDHPVLVAPGALIPRYDTEDWLEVCFPILRKKFSDRPFSFADIGTGTGVIGLALLGRFPQARGWLSDLSPAALAVAKKNLAMATDPGNRTSLVLGKALTHFGSRVLDLVISNPPYIPTNELAELTPEIREHEPVLALDGGEDGLTMIRELFREAPRVLRAGGILAFEHAHGQRASILRETPAALIRLESINDAQGRERALVFQCQN